MCGLVVAARWRERGRREAACGTAQGGGGGVIRGSQGSAGGTGALTCAAGVHRGVLQPAGRHAVQLAQGGDVGAPVAVGDHHHAAVRAQAQRQLLPCGAVQRRLLRGCGLLCCWLMSQQRRSLARIGEQKVNALRGGQARRQMWTDAIARGKGAGPRLQGARRGKGASVLLCTRGGAAWLPACLHARLHHCT